ncbi:MAG: hypothetical protein DKM50_13540 [Candidatus Margulisiibacteriota bacterium]|nr:MAG: hypothetical protein A2X43_10690 [Candidatus Margulisbacteria bacterium GWD2_39_127]OGI04441.1 MAG: hypothetical protein A2X42_04015 [Candidatus Margulisbacteria bacterium GWF2_38_17]OGI07151.1 MAG: hypothetical protein A2X41_06085 [Candidatus Margulisbacteria bacterium GWE2_39_32]PZM77271.1 MAG: hypothetical protein DKM50_13540 [Candidatus Margulisiibacteriota bacterium]HAR64396.1 hypothetical protein [Candidatus Margulisiibacteriota bacterium]
MKKTIVSIFAFIIGLLSVAQAITVDEFILKVKENQDKIHSFEAMMTTTIRSSAIAREIIQKAKYYKKGIAKIRVEAINPMKQTTIYNGNEVIMIGADGQKTKLPKIGESMDMAEKSPLSYLDKFNMVLDENGSSLVIKGTPKVAADKDSIGTITFVANKKDYTISKMTMLRKDGQPMLDSDMQYIMINNIPILKSMDSSIEVNGQKMKVYVVYDDIKINENLPDLLFQ